MEPGQERIKKPKTGGRQKGTPNKKTAEKAMIAQRIVAEAEMRGEKLAKEVLNEFMKLFSGMAAFYQPQPQQGADGKPVLVGGNEDRFLQYARLAAGVAKDLAPYQSPTFRAIMVNPAPPPDPTGGKKQRTFTLSVFENGARGDIRREVKAEVIPPPRKPQKAKA